MGLKLSQRGKEIIFHIFLIHVAIFLHSNLQCINFEFGWAWPPFQVPGLRVVTWGIRKIPIWGSAISHCGSSPFLFFKGISLPFYNDQAQYYQYCRDSKHLKRTKVGIKPHRLGQPFIVVLIPLTEELYFRGYLLPRMPAGSKVWASVFHSALFALYHTWTPWMFVARTLGVLPLIYIVRKKENIYLGIIAHIILNSLDFITGLVFILTIWTEIIWRNIYSFL